MAMTIKHDGSLLRLNPPCLELEPSWPSNTKNPDDLAVITLEGPEGDSVTMGLDRESIIVLRDSLEALLRRAR